MKKRKRTPEEREAELARREELSQRMLALIDRYKRLAAERRTAS